MLDRRSERTRTVASLALVVAAGVLVVLGTLALYARVAIVDENAFADRAVEALKNEDVRSVVGEEIVVNIADRASSDLIAARPLVQAVVDEVLSSTPFQRLFREAAVHANRLLFARDRSSVTFDLPGVFSVLKFGLQSVDPKLADELPRGLEPSLLELKKRDFARNTLAAADHMRTLGIVLPILAVLALALSVYLSPRRRTAIVRAAVAAAAAGALIAIVMLIVRSRLLAGIHGADELTDADLRAAVAGLLDAYFGSLFGWAVALALGGSVVAAAAATLDAARPHVGLEALRAALSARPESTGWRAARGFALLALAAFVALEPDLALHIVALLGAALLAYLGTTELLLLLRPRDAVSEGERRARRRTLARASVAAAAVVVVGVVAVLVVTGGGNGRSRTKLASTEGCEGSFALCRLPLNQVAFAGTHNSMSAADSPGWYISNQRRTIARQLQDGIRLLLIDPHWGVRTNSGHVKTDFDAEGRDRNKVAKALPPDVLQTVQRLAGSLGVGSASGKPEVYLCHTVCELGATRMVDAMTVLRRFLDENPGEVVILFVEPYVSPQAILDVFKQAGLDHYLATLDRDAPLPTLGDLVKRNKRLIVFTEHDATARYPWYMDGFSYVQDTPLGAQHVSDLSCAPSRGTASSPLLMMNHWSDLFPPRPSANTPFNQGNEILRRAHQCARRRGMPVNLIAVDHYDTGNLISSVAQLNREQIAAAKQEGEQLSGRSSAGGQG